MGEVLAVRGLAGIGGSMKVSGDEPPVDTGNSARQGGTSIWIVEADGDVVELAAVTAKGEITVITGMTKEGDSLILRGLHIAGPGAGALGIQELRRLARELCSQQGAQQVTIYGGRRTTGAHVGYAPRPITFSVGGR